MEDDIVKAQSGYSVYRDGEWVGSLQHFVPGVGYMYYSNRMGMASFVFAGSASQLTVTTVPPTDITSVSAVSGGTITSNDGNYGYVFLKGVCWATHTNPRVMNDSFTESGNGLGAFTAEMTDLTPNTLYYVRAYAVTLEGTIYGEEVSFTTSTPQTDYHFVVVTTTDNNVNTTTYSTVDQLLVSGNTIHCNKTQSTTPPTYIDTDTYHGLGAGRKVFVIAAPIEYKTAKIYVAGFDQGLTFTLEPPAESMNGIPYSNGDVVNYRLFKYRCTGVSGYIINKIELTQ